MVPTAPVMTAIMWDLGRATVPSGPGEALSQGLWLRGRRPESQGTARSVTRPGAPACALPGRLRAAGFGSDRTAPSQQKGTETAQAPSARSPLTVQWSPLSFLTKPCSQGSGTLEDTLLCCLDKRGCVRTSVLWRQVGPHRSPPCCPWPAGPSWLSDRHRWLDVCFSRLGRGATPRDPVPNPLSSRGHQVLVRALRGGLA